MKELVRKTVFLSTPSATYSSLDDARKEARALLAYITYNHKYSNFCVEIGVSNVDSRKATYQSIANGVGRPKRLLIGDIENCYVEPHLHILIQGEHVDTLSNMIINYLRERHSSHKDDDFTLHIWKNSIPAEDVKRTRNYIECQSKYILTVSEFNDDIDDSFDESESLFEEEQYVEEQSEPIAYDNVKHQIRINNLRFQWILAEQLKKTANHIVAYHIADELDILQQQICAIASRISSNYFVDDYELLYVTQRLESLRKTVAKTKEIYLFSTHIVTELNSE